MDCQNCNEQQRRAHGYYPDHPAEEVWDFNGQDLRRCPGCLINQQSMEYIQAYVFLKQFHKFPVDSGWQEQPVKLLRAIGHVESVIEEIRQEEEKEAERKQSMAQTGF